MTLVRSTGAPATARIPAPATPSVLEEVLARADWALTDAARLDLAEGERLDAGHVEGALVVILDGEVEAQFDGIASPLRSGFVLLRMRPATMRLRALADARVVIGSLRLGGDLDVPLLRHLPEALVACELLATDAQVAALAGMLSAEILGERPGSVPLSCRIAGLLAAAAVRAWVEHGCAPDGWSSARVDPGIARALDAIRDDPGAAWTLERLARVAHTSRSAFAERFRAAVGDSPARYLARVRMERAKSLLAADRLSVAQAAICSGYGSDAAFSRAFARHTGVSPSAWRRAGRGSAAALRIGEAAVSSGATVASS